jgi:CheY-like chemotaxis protein
MQQTILIIDDSKDDVLITRIALSKTGRDLRTEVASDGEAGLALLRDAKELPALILLDLKMAGMSGFDVLRLIRADAHVKDLPVVVVTSSSLEADRKQSYASGADGFLHKDIDINRFTKDIKHILDRWLKAA